MNRKSLPQFILQERKADYTHEEASLRDSHFATSRIDCASTVEKLHIACYARA
jgi:hypothetical protein